MLWCAGGRCCVLLSCGSRFMCDIAPLVSKRIFRCCCIIFSYLDSVEDCLRHFCVLESFAFACSVFYRHLGRKGIDVSRAASVNHLCTIISLCRYHHSVDIWLKLFVCLTCMFCSLESLSICISAGRASMYHGQRQLIIYLLSYPYIAIIIP